MNRLIITLSLAALTLAGCGSAKSVSDTDKKLSRKAAEEYSKVITAEWIADSKTAVADEQFREVLTCALQPSENDEIVLTEYKPNALTYYAKNANDRIAVFSEIYYPEGWHIYVDGKEIALGRVNYILRAAVIPAGEHTITMQFVPTALILDKWSYALAILLLLITIGCLTWPLWKGWLPTKAK